MMEGKRRADGNSDDLPSRHPHPFLSLPFPFPLPLPIPLAATYLPTVRYTGWYST